MTWYTRVVRSFIALAALATGMVALASPVGASTGALSGYDPLGTLASAGAASAVTCAGSGDCVTGGWYTDGSGNTQAWLAEESGGSWGAAFKVAGSANTAGDARVTSIACSSVGNCAASGWYTNGTGQQAFVVLESSGSWGSTTDVASVVSAGNSSATGVACPADGSCVVVGWYTDASSVTQAFSNSETAGTWNGDYELGVSLNVDGAKLVSVACTSTSACATGGWYTDAGAIVQPLVAAGAYNALTGAQTLGGVVTSGGTVAAVACGTTTCWVGGTYQASGTWAMTASESSGTWSGASALSSPGGVSATGSTLGSLSCTGSSCVAGGGVSITGGTQAIVADETSGTWTSQTLGVNLNTGTAASTTAVACAGPSSCVAGGIYTSTTSLPFAAASSGGSWSEALRVADNSATSSGTVTGAACASDGSCIVVGSGSIGGAASPFVTKLDTLVTPPALSGTGTVHTVMGVSNGTWLFSPGSYSYQWYTCASSHVANPGPSSDCTAIAGATSATYTLTSVEVGQYVSAMVSAATEQYWSATTFVTGVTPSAPTSVAVSAGQQSVYVSWSAPNDNGGASITQYTATSSPGGLGCTTTGAGTGCTVTGLTNGISYTFSVTATNSAGVGTASVSNAVIPAGVPNAPGNVTETGSAGTSLVTWNAPSDNGGIITGYTISYSSNDGATWVLGGSVNGNTLSDTLSGLTGSTTYLFEVTATNWVGTGAPGVSSEVAVSTLPGAPTNVQATVSHSSVTVLWSGAPSNGSPITGYKVTASPGGLTCTSTVTYCTFTTLTGGLAYTFTVTATNAAGTGVASAATTSVTPLGVPGVVSGITATSGNGTVKVTWSAPVNTGGAAIIGYTVTTLPGGAACTSTGTSCTVAGLTDGTSYTFSVTATNSEGTGTAAVSNVATPAETPGAVGTITVKISGNTATVSWATGANNGSVITKYVVASSPGAKGCTVIVARCVVRGLAWSTSYTFVVTAYNAAGSGPGVRSAAVHTAGLAGEVGSVSVVSGYNTATVHWTVPLSVGGAPVTSYRVTARPGGSTCITKLTSCTVTGLTPKASYTFAVAAHNTVGWGRSVISAKTRIAVPAPQYLIGPFAGNGSTLTTSQKTAIVGAGLALAQGTFSSVSVSGYVPVSGGGSSTARSRATAVLTYLISVLRGMRVTSAQLSAWGIGSASRVNVLEVGVSRLYSKVGITLNH